MKRRLYVIHDSVAGEVFGPVMVLPNDAVAVRTFRDSLFHQEAKHREDYDLYCLGELDTESGSILPVAESGAVFNVVSPVITGAALVAAANAASGKDGSNGEA